MDSKKMSFSYCRKNTCGNWNKNSCMIKEPEKINGGCLHFEDNIALHRLKTQAVICKRSKQKKENKKESYDNIKLFRKRK
jgi:hypothetical protein